MKTLRQQSFKLVVVQDGYYFDLHIALLIDDRLVEQAGDFKNGDIRTLRIHKLFAVFGRIVSTHRTFEEAGERFNELQRMLTSTVLNESDKISMLGEYAFDGAYFEVINGKDAVLNPYKYFRPGDNAHAEHAIIKHAGIVVQTSLYTDENQVIQVSDPDNGLNKKNACVNRAPWTRFRNKAQKFLIYFPFFKHRSNEEIIAVAEEELAKYESKFNDYNFFWRNCQHFATYCQIGKERFTQFSNVVQLV